jgi:hypothetical protein
VTRALWALHKLLAFQRPHVRDNHYVSPPPAIRYMLERWSGEDERDNQQAGETYAPTYCVACYAWYCVGEWYVDDTLSCDTFCVACTPPLTRTRALLGTILCALRAILVP